MKEKEGNKTPRQPAKKPNKLAVDARIKTQIKRKVDAAKATVAKRTQDATDDPDGAPKKEVSFDPTVHVQGSEPETLAPPEDERVETDVESPGRERRSTQDGADENTEGSANQETEHQEGKREIEKSSLDEVTKEEDKKDVDKKEDEKEDKKSGKKGKKKGKGKKDKKEERKKDETKPAPEMPVGEVTAGVEELRKFVCEKVQNALEIVCTDGVTEMTVDNVTPLLKSLDIDTNDEAILDLIRDSLIDNFGVVNPLELDTIVQKSQEAKEETEMDDCLEVAFKLIDIDDDGFITQPDIYKFMLKLGEVLAEYALDDMLAAVDMDQDGKISLRDFRYFLLGRDVPSRKEIFAMAAAARKKREEEEERKRQEEQAEAEGAAATANTEEKIENNDEESIKQKESEENDAHKTEELSSAEVKTSVSDAESDHPQKSPRSCAEKATDPATLKRKSLFAGCVKSVIAANTFNSVVETSTLKGTGEKQKSLPYSEPSDELKTPADNLKQVQVEKDNSEYSQVVEQMPDIKSDREDREAVAEMADESTKDILRNGADDVLIDTANDNYDHSEDEEVGGPEPLGLAAQQLYPPPPDFADVTKFVPSPCPSPIPSPRGRPSIVGIGGLVVSAMEEDKSYAQAIHFLQEDMFKGDNEVPQRPRRKASEGTPVEETMINSVQDVEDYNNRLVFKLPPRRKSSCYDPSTLQPLHDKNAEKFIGSADSDEGIDLAEEEFIEQTYVVPCAAAPPMTTLRISLPNNEDIDADDPISINNTARNSRRGSRLSIRRRSKDDASLKDGEMSTLSIGLMPDTPRSMSRSEYSHISLVSPRTDCQISDDEADGDDFVHEDNTEHNLPASHTAMDTSNKSDCDADSVWLTMGGSEVGSARDSFGRNNLQSSPEDLDVFDANALSDDSRCEKLSSSRSPRQKNTKILKRSLSCQRIELKELSLENPVTVDQFSNRHKFGMIPRKLSKFLVLGKSPPMESPKKPEHTRIRIKDTPELINPSLQVRGQGRPQTATLSSRERDVLQERRIRLMEGQSSPLLDQRRNFDIPSLSSSLDKIEVPTGNETPTNDLLDRVKTMERKILKRSKTSFELPVLDDLHSREGSTPTKHEKTKASEKGRTISRSYHRKSGSISFDRYNDTSSAQDRRVSVVDLSKSLRKDSACKSMASLSKRHSGFKSIVPLARVVMAYQSVKRKRNQNGFYSISRQLEKSGVPFQSKSRPNSPRKPSYAVASSARGEKKRRWKLGRRRCSSAERLTDLIDPFIQRPDEDVATLVGDMKDPDIIPQDVVFEKVRPLTAQPCLGSSSRSMYPPTSRGMVPLSQSKIMTLEIPDANKFDKKVKNVSLLSKLPIR